MLATMLVLFGVAGVGSLLLVDDEQTVEPESEDRPEQEFLDGTDDILSSIERGNAADEGAADVNSSGDVSFWLDDSSLERALEPLDDWTQSENVPILGGDQTDSLVLSEYQNESLLSIDANYTETIQSGEGGSTQEFMDGADDVLSSIEKGNAADEGAEDVNSSDNVSFRFDDSSLEKAPEPLDDWTQSENVPILGGDQTVILEFSQDLNGSLQSIDANYTETIRSDENAPIQTHVGQNVYFVPEGETFPPEYNWSIEGNSLYNSDTHVDDTTAFGGIKLVARLDGGSFLSSPTGTVVQDQTYQLPTLMSNLRFS